MFILDYTCKKCFRRLEPKLACFILAFHQLYSMVLFHEVMAYLKCMPPNLANALFYFNKVVALVSVAMGAVLCVGIIKQKAALVMAYLLVQHTSVLYAAVTGLLLYVTYYEYDAACLPPGLVAFLGLLNVLSSDSDQPKPTESESPAGRGPPHVRVMLLHLTLLALWLCADVIIYGKNDNSPKPLITQSDTNLQFDNVPMDALRNINIENLDVDRLRRKMDEVMLMEEKKLKPVESRRAASLHLRDGVWPYYQALTFRARRRTIDNMVQILVMGRTALREMQQSEYYDTKDSNFRVAYAYRASQKVHRNAHIAYKTALSKAPYWYNMSYHLIIHSKIVRAHLDYAYMYWVGVRIDQAMKLRELAKRRIRAQKLRRQQRREMALKLRNESVSNDTTPSS